MQYVVLRRDLWADLGWPLGSVVAQACHAATAALWLSREEPATSSYCAADSIDHMHKVPLACVCHAAYPLFQLPRCCTVACSNVSTCVRSLLSLVPVP